jgi:Tfp pilus assembly ATPase PilU
MDLETLLDRMAETGATSLYLSSQNPPVFRINGTLQTDGETRLTPEGVARLLAPVLSAGQSETALQGGVDVPVRIERRDVIVEGQIFEYVGTLAAAFHRG